MDYHSTASSSPPPHRNSPVWAWSKKRTIGHTTWHVIHISMLCYVMASNVLGCRPYDFWPSELHEKILTLLGKIRLSLLFSKINWTYNSHNMSAAIWNQKFLLKSDLCCPDHLHRDMKMKVSSMGSRWCIRFWHTIYRHQLMTQILK